MRQTSYRGGSKFITPYIRMNSIATSWGPLCCWVPDSLPPTNLYEWALGVLSLHRCGRVTKSSSHHVQWWDTPTQLKPRQAQWEEISAFMSAGKIRSIYTICAICFCLYKSSSYIVNINNACWSLKGMWCMPVIHWRGRWGRSSCGFRDRSSWIGTALTVPSPVRHEEMQMSLTAQRSASNDSRTTIIYISMWIRITQLFLNVCDL